MVAAPLYIVVVSLCCMLRLFGVMPFRSAVPLVRGAGWRLDPSAGKLSRWERWLVSGSVKAPQNKRSGAEVRADQEVWCSSPWRHGGGEKRDVHIVLVKAGSTALRETRAHGLPWALDVAVHGGVNQRRPCLPTLSTATGSLRARLPGQLELVLPSVGGSWSSARGSHPASLQVV